MTDKSSARNDGNVGVLTSAGEIHRSGDSVVSVDRQRDKYVRRAVRDDRLQVPYQFAGDISRVPGHRRSPNNIRGNGYQAHQ